MNINTTKDIPLIEYLDNVWKLKESYKFFKFNEFDDYDVRNTFSKKISNSIAIYYFGISIAYMGHKFKEPCKLNMMQEIFDFSFSEMEKDNFSNIGVIDINTPYYHTYISGLKLNLIFSCWISFESSISFLYKNLISIEIANRKKNEIYDKVKKIMSDISFEKYEERLGKLLENTHIPITFKYNQIFKIIDENIYEKNRNITEDKVFLDFFGFIRNTFHDNSFSNHDRTFLVYGKEFIIKKGENINFGTEAFILEMVKELAEIYHNICLSLKTNTPIIDALEKINQ